MKKITVVTISFLFLSIALYGQIPAGYYDSATGSGYTLKTQLHNIIDDHTVVSYTSLWTYYYTSDADSYYENDGSVLDMYSENPSGNDTYNFTFGSDQCGTYSTEGDCYNREHSMPQSWFNEQSPMVSDIFHIYPTDGKVNGMRSSWPFGEVSAPTWTSENGSKLGPCSYPGYSGTVFEPIDEFKGDFARSYFYMAARYEDVISGWSSPILNGSSDQVYTDWHLNLLIDWHAADPVSQKEIDRNNIIYADIQHNRNPFIDHPEYVNSIWGGTPPVPSVNFVTASQSFEENSGAHTVTLSISQAVPDDVTANITVTGSASNGSDYTISQSYVFFPASSTGNQSVTLTIINDADPEDFETVVLTINNLVTDNTEIIIGPQDEITFTINNNDGFDETPPYITGHTLLNDSTLILTFSEKLDPLSSETEANYVVDNGIGYPLNALLGYGGDSAKVELPLPVLSPGINYHLTINNVEDLAGNPIAANNTVNFAISSGGGDGWIEDFEMANWGTYSTGTFTLTTGDWDIVDVYPETSAANAYEGSHAVRLNDDTANSSLTSPAVNGVDSVIFWYRTLNQEASVSTFWLQKSVGGGAFTNVTSRNFQNNTYTELAFKVNDHSDNIRLRILNNNQAGHLIVDYFKVVTFSAPAADTTPPGILSHEILNGSDIILSFSEKLDPSTSQTLTNYVLDNGTGNPDTAVLGYGGDSSKVALSFSPFQEDINYQLTINNVEDLAGNPIAANTIVDFIINAGSGGGEGWIERFEDGTTFTSYYTGTITYGTGDWDLVSVYLEPANESYEGNHALRINDDTVNASLTSPAVNGLDSVIFYYRALNSEASPSTFWLQKSINEGTYTNIQSQSYQVATYNRFAYKVNDPSDNVKLRVLNNNQAGHLIIDYFKVVTFPQNLNSPANVSTAINGSDITIIWDPVSGAVSYDVYSSNLPYTGFAIETTVTTPEFTTNCTDSKKFYYIVASTTAKALKHGESHERFIEIKIPGK